MGCIRDLAQASVPRALGPAHYAVRPLHLCKYVLISLFPFFSRLFLRSRWVGARAFIRKPKQTRPCRGAGTRVAQDAAARGLCAQRLHGLLRQELLLRQLSGLAA